MLLQEGLGIKGILFIGSSGMLLLCFAIIFFVVLYQKKLLANKLQLINLEGKHKDELLQATIENVENERKRIARDLHDEVGLQFTLMSRKVEQYQIAFKDGSNQVSLNELHDIANKGLESTRRIAYDMIPPELETIGLSAALENLCSQINKSASIDIKVTPFLPVREPEDKISLALFRVTQELISNTLKYASAKSIEIELFYEGNALKYLYKDDGIGFSISNVMTNESLGLRSIDNRVKMIKGKIEYQTRPGNGLVVTVEIPNQYGELN